MTENKKDPHLSPTFVFFITTSTIKLQIIDAVTISMQLYSEYEHPQ